MPTPFAPMFVARSNTKLALLNAPAAVVTTVTVAPVSPNERMSIP